MGYHYGILALGVSALILASPFVLWMAHHIVHRPPSRKQIAMIIAAFQPSIDANTAAATSLQASATSIAALLANPILPPGAASETDVTDTATALTASSEAVTAAAAAVAAAIPAPAEPAA